MQIFDWFLPTAPFWLAAGAFAFIRWQLNIRSLFIRRAEIEREADELIAAHGDRAEAFAEMEEDRAWRYSMSLEQGKWRRIRMCLQGRRQLSRGTIDT